MPDIQNPNQEPGTERRLLLVFALTFLVIIAFQPLLKKYGPQPAAPAPQAQQQVQPGPAAAAPSPVAAPAAPAAGTRQASAETETVIENNLYRVTFTNRGAQVKSWVLKKFDDEERKPLDLVSPVTAEKFGYPLSLWTYDETLRNRLSSALYVSSNVGNLSAPAQLTFEYSAPDLSVRKTISFDSRYLLHVETEVQMNGNWVTALPVWPAGFIDKTAGRFNRGVSSISLTHANLIEYQLGSSIERLASKKISGGATLPGPFAWAGVSDQYFAAVFLPDDPASVSMVTLHNGLEVPKDAQDPNSHDTVKVDILGAAVGNPHGPTIERMYVGPKELAVLENVSVPAISGASPDLRGLVDFGWLGLISRPLFLWLKWTYNHIVPNWGWAIVLQTLIIALAMLPLRISQMKSMLKMQRVAPQIKSIQEKYKKYSMRDPRKAPMNEEVAALYKKEGVNPAGGCLPMLIQMPFLFAYYRMLGVALDLRHAQWLWIHDLSARDPYFLLPIFLVISMFLTQRMTPQGAMDPSQQKMMNWMMPAMMGFIFFNLAAGLNLYYAESNLIGIIQQSIMNRTTLGREMREMMEKRARKKDK